MKKTLTILYVAVIAVMAAATFIEKQHGTTYVATHIYGSWWFSALWALLAAAAVAWFLRRRVRRLSAVVLHLSFLVILAGALLTHLTAQQGIIHLRIGEATSRYLSTDHGDNTVRELPFSIRLDKFSVSYHEGTKAASDYVSQFTITQGNNEHQGMVSMNNIYHHGAVRLYQSSYDDDMQGSYLSMNSDPWGIPVTYMGYGMLFVGLVWMLIDPKGAYRRLMRHPMLRKGALTLTALACCHSLSANTNATTLPRQTADALGRLYINYNDRICPLQTFALDFTKKIYGKRSYKGLTAEQVLAGFILWPEEWDKEPIIRVKSSELRQAKGLDRHCSVDDFFSKEKGYLLGPLLQEYYQGHADKLHQEVMKMDDRLQIIMQLRQGRLLRLFPVTLQAPHSTRQTVWFSPADRFPDTVEKERQQYILNIFSVIRRDAHDGNFKRVDEALQKLLRYQHTYGAPSLPSETRTLAERAYNAFPFATVLFMLNLTMGILLLVYFIYRMTKGKTLAKSNRTLITYLPHIVLLLSFLALSCGLALRWIASGTIPMSNGYETMLLMAWMIMLIALLYSRRFPILLCFGFLMSGFFLLVSHISQMDPQITHLMPVLSSPLLTVHVSIIMMAFALLALTFISSLTALVIHTLSPRSAHTRPRAPHPKSHASLHLALLSRLFLYPAITCLGFGIFIGAIWANVSWGTYWSWDPKETWALITLMVYAVAIHDRSFTQLQRPLTFHIFMVLAFLTILMTYFGVNYFLGGMHSYA